MITNVITCRLWYTSGHQNHPHPACSCSDPIADKARSFTQGDARHPHSIHNMVHDGTAPHRARSRENCRLSCVPCLCLTAAVCPLRPSSSFRHYQKPKKEKNVENRFAMATDCHACFTLMDFSLHHFVVFMRSELGPYAPVWEMFRRNVRVWHSRSTVLRTNLPAMLGMMTYSIGRSRCAA